MTERAVPFHCPYCGEEDLRPHEIVSESGEVSSPHGTWECRGCQRAFSLKMLGLLRHSAVGAFEASEASEAPEGGAPS